MPSTTQTETSHDSYEDRERYRKDGYDEAAKGASTNATSSTQRHQRSEEEGARNRRIEEEGARDRRREEEDSRHRRRGAEGGRSSRDTGRRSRSPRRPITPPRKVSRDTGHRERRSHRDRSEESDDIDITYNTSQLAVRRRDPSHEGGRRRRTAKLVPRESAMEDFRWADGELQSIFEELATTVERIPDVVGFMRDAFHPLEGTHR